MPVASRQQPLQKCTGRHNALLPLMYRRKPSLWERAAIPRWLAASPSTSASLHVLSSLLKMKLSRINWDCKSYSSGGLPGTIINSEDKTCLQATRIWLRRCAMDATCCTACKCPTNSLSPIVFVTMLCNAWQTQNACSLTNTLSTSLKQCTKKAFSLLLALHPSGTSSRNEIPPCVTPSFRDSTDTCSFEPS